MGRAISMENELDIIKNRVSKVEAQVRGMVATIEELKSVSSRKVMINETNEQESNKKATGTSSDSGNKGRAKPKSKAK